MVEVPGIEHPVFGWLLVDLRFEKWRQACFVPTDMVRGTDGYPKPLRQGYQLQADESILVGWEHTHCRVCHFSFPGIEHPNPAVSGWTDDRAGYWLCDQCHAGLTAWWAANPMPGDWRPYAG